MPNISLGLIGPKLDLLSGEHCTFQKSGSLRKEDKNMNELGLSLDRSLVLEEMLELSEELRKCENCPLETDSLFRVAAANLIWKIASTEGEKFRYDDAETKDILRKIYSSSSLSVKRNSARAEAENITNQSLQLRLLTTHDANSIDAFPKSMEMESRLFAMLTSAMKWAVLALTSSPSVQRRIQSEIDIVVGRRFLKTERDEKGLNYVRATIEEILRFASISSVSSVFAADEEISTGKCVIPKDARICVNFLSVLRDPKLFHNAEDFDPWRFIDPKTQLFRSDFDDSVFGEFERLAKNVVREELIVFVTTLMQRFEVHPEDEAFPPAMKAAEKCGRIREPQKFRVIFKQRQNRM